MARPGSLGVSYSVRRPDKFQCWRPRSAVSGAAGTLSAAGAGPAEPGFRACRCGLVTPAAGVLALLLPVPGATGPACRAADGTRPASAVKPTAITLGKSPPSGRGRVLRSLPTLSISLPAIHWCRWRPEQQFCRADEPIRAAGRMPGLWASGFSPGPVSPARRAISQTVSAGRGRFAPAGGRLLAEGDELQFIDDAVGVAFGSQTACHPRGSSDSGIFYHSGDGASETSLRGKV
jgi:hypothetical protein